MTKKIGFVAVLLLFVSSQLANAHFLPKATKEYAVAPKATKESKPNNPKGYPIKLTEDPTNPYTNRAAKTNAPTTLTYSSSGTVKGSKKSDPIKLTDVSSTETKTQAPTVSPSGNFTAGTNSTTEAPAVTETPTKTKAPVTTSAPNRTAMPIRTVPPITSEKRTLTEPTILWAEEFDYNGAPNPSIWSHDVGGGGWGNNELQVYTSAIDNSVVQDGILKITARRDGDSFTSARLKTEGKFTFTYGTIEARIRVPDMNAGLWPAFWTLGGDFYQVGWPKSGEVDIMEMGQGLAIEQGLVNQRVVSAAHWDIFGQYATYARSYDSSVDLTQDFHIFRLDWTPEKMTTSVDGNWIWEIDIADGACPSCQELHQPHHLLLSMAVGGGFTSGGTSSSASGSSSSSSSSSSSCAGSSSSAGASSSGGCPSRGPDDITAPLPAELQVDWIRLYDNGYTSVANSPPTLNPTPSPTAGLRNPQTAQPTPLPTNPPTAALRNPLTPPPSVIIPVTLFPATPVTETPQVGLTRAPGPSGKAGGKAGGKSGGTNSRQSVFSRSNSHKSKGKSGGFSSGFSRSGVAGGKAKGKGGKGRWSRSGTTATATGTGTGTDGTWYEENYLDSYYGTETTDSTGTGDSFLRNPDTSSAPAPTVTPVMSRSPGSTAGMNFDPANVGETTTDASGNTGSLSSQMGPQSLVVERKSSAVCHASRLFLSLVLTGLVALGLVTSAVS